MHETLSAISVFSHCLNNLGDARLLVAVECCSNNLRDARLLAECFPNNLSDTARLFIMVGCLRNIRSAYDHGEHSRLK
jgi:hypothetical protein